MSEPGSVSNLLSRCFRAAYFLEKANLLVQDTVAGGGKLNDRLQEGDCVVCKTDSSPQHTREEVMTSRSHDYIPQLHYSFFN